MLRKLISTRIHFRFPKNTNDSSTSEKLCTVDDNKPSSVPMDDDQADSNIVNNDENKMVKWPLTSKHLYCFSCELATAVHTVSRISLI